MLSKPSNRQQQFREIVLGTLVYSVVLGFFNDYTHILYTRSYSITFAAAFVLQILTYLTLELKNIVARWFGQNKYNKAGLYVCIWLILFLSKFVFLEAIDIVFGESIQISNFVGLMAIILCMTIAKELIDYTYNRLDE